MSSDFDREKKPLLNYCEHSERAQLVDSEDFDSMPPRKRKSGKRRKGGVKKRKGGVRFVKGRVSIKGKKYSPSLLIRQINNAVLNKAASKLNSKSGGKVRKSRKGRKKVHKRRKR